MCSIPIVMTKLGQIIMSLFETSFVYQDTSAFFFL